MTITAKIIADSISEQGVRITTIELEYPRYIHSQFMTHRQFSRNAQSSRAIPTAKQIELIRDLPAPNFAQNKAGMQAGESLSGFTLESAQTNWQFTKDKVINCALSLVDYGVHKQWANRLLEPFSTIKVVVTATEWDNFFKLRLHHDAQPEIQELAQAMKDAMDGSRPDILKSGEWHLPYINSGDCFSREQLEKIHLISAARCARVSYLNHDNTNPNIGNDLELAKKLLDDGHLSPFEHQAKPIDDAEFEKTGFDFDEFDGITHIDKKSRVWSNNFCGWIQHRALLQ